MQLIWPRVRKMLENLDKKQQRWLAVGLLAGVVLFFCLIIFIPLFSSIFEYNETIDDLQFRLNRYSRKIADERSMLKQVNEVKSQLNNAEFFSSQKTAALAIADMQKKIKQAVSSAGGQLSSTQALPQQQLEELTKIIVKVRLSGTMAAVKDILYEIEKARPYLIVEKLTINQVRGKRNRKTRKIEPVDKLNLNMEVVGFMRGTEG